jgi:hypothetical protein
LYFTPAVNYTERKVSATVIVSTLMVFNTVTARAQHGNGTTGISGSITAALRISVPRDAFRQDPLAPARIDFEGETSNAVQIGVSGAAAQSGEIFIPLEIRTNVPYEMHITVAGHDGCLPELTASIVAAQPSGSLVRAAAIESLAASAASLNPGAGSRPVLSGPRVSLGGSLTSRNNALIARLAIRTGAAACAWRASLLLILTPAGQ